MARKRGHRETEAPDVKSSSNKECKKSKHEEKGSSNKNRFDPIVNKINTSGKDTENLAENEEKKTSSQVENKCQSTNEKEISSASDNTKLTVGKEKEVEMKSERKRRGRPSKKSLENAIETEGDSDVNSTKKFDNESDEKAGSERKCIPEKNGNPVPRKRGRPPKKSVENTIVIEDDADKQLAKKSNDVTEEEVKEKESGPTEVLRPEPRRRGRPSKKIVEKSIEVDVDSAKKSEYGNKEKKVAVKEPVVMTLTLEHLREMRRSSQLTTVDKSAKGTECSKKDLGTKPDKEDSNMNRSVTKEAAVTTMEVGERDKSKDLENTSNEIRPTISENQDEPVVRTSTSTLENQDEGRRSGRVRKLTDKAAAVQDSFKSKVRTKSPRRSLDQEEHCEEPSAETSEDDSVSHRSSAKVPDKKTLQKGNKRPYIRTKISPINLSAKVQDKLRVRLQKAKADSSSENKNIPSKNIPSNDVSAKGRKKVKVRRKKIKDSSTIENENISSISLSAKVQDKLRVRLQKDKGVSSFENENIPSSDLSAKVPGKVQATPTKVIYCSNIENKNNSSSNLSGKVQGKPQMGKGISFNEKSQSSIKPGEAKSPSKIVHSDHSFCKVDSSQIFQDMSGTEDDIEGEDDDFGEDDDDIELLEDDIEAEEHDFEAEENDNEAGEEDVEVEEGEQLDGNAEKIQGTRIKSPCPVSLHLNDHIKTVGNDQKLDSSVSENNKEPGVEMEQTNNLDLPKNVDDLDLSKSDPKESPPATTIDLNSMLTMAESEEKVLGGVSALIKDSLLQINGMRQFVIHDLPSLTNITCFQTADKIAISGTIQGVNRAWSILTNIERNVHSKDVQNKKAVRIQWKGKNGLERAVEFKRVPESHHYKKSARKFVKPVTVFVDVKTPVAVSDQVSDTEKENVTKSTDDVQIEAGSSTTQQSPEPPKVSLLSGKPFSRSRIQIEGQVGIPVSKKQTEESRNFSSICNASSPTYRITVDKSVDLKISSQGRHRMGRAKDIQQSSEGKHGEVNESSVHDESYDDYVDDVDDRSDEDDNSDAVLWEGKVENVDGQKYLCEHCSETFPSKNEFLSHKFYEHEDEDGNVLSFVECDDCSQRFRCRLELHRHKKRAHSLVSLLPKSNKGSHVCNVCQKSFTEKRYLTTHLKRHTGIKNHKCDICGWRFFEAHKLKFHLETHKERSKRQLPYQCTICLRQYHNRQSWNDHMNTHTGSKPYKCQVCGAGFAHRIGLHRHKLIHEKDCPYKCTYCHRGFKVKANLTAHMTIHTGVGKHTCPQCQKVFTVATSLRRHRCQPPNPESRAEAPGGGEGEESYMFMCGVCSITFPTLQEAETHSLAHVDTPSESVNLEGLQVEEIANETDILATDPVEAGTTYYIQAQNTEEGTVALNTTTAFHGTIELQNTAHVSVASSASVDEVEKLQMAASTLADLSTLSKDTDLVANGQPINNVVFSGDAMSSTKFVTMTTAGLIPQGQAEVVSHMAMAGGLVETMELVNPEHVTLATTNQDIVSMIATTGHDIVTMATANNEAVMVTTQAQTSEN